MHTHTQVVSFTDDDTQAVDDAHTPRWTCSVDVALKRGRGGGGGLIYFFWGGDFIRMQTNHTVSTTLTHMTLSSTCLKLYARARSAKEEEEEEEDGYS